MGKTTDKMEPYNTMQNIVYYYLLSIILSLELDKERKYNASIIHH